MADDNSNRRGLVRLIPGTPTPAQPASVIPRNNIPFKRMFEAGIGRVVVVELKSGTKISGEVLNVYDEFIDTDSGIIRLDDISHARWMSAEEAAIARGGPLQRRW